MTLCLVGVLETQGYGAVKKNDRTFGDSCFTVISAEEYFESGQRAMEFNNWNEAIKQFNALLRNWPNSSLCQEEVYFYMGQAYYKLGEYDFANESFTNYLKVKSSPEFFEEAISYKFSIAEQFRGGARRRPFAAQHFPKWLSANQEALDIYDEVIAAMPSHHLAALSYFYKGCLLWRLKEFGQAVESYQMLIRRFPKHELAPAAYLNITKVFLDQSQREFQNSDLIALAEINLKKFRSEFPRDEYVGVAEQEVARIKEVYACGLYKTAYFYERVGKPRASIIYYENAILQFPSTDIAKHCRSRLSRLAPNTLEHVDLQLQARWEAEQALECLETEEEDPIDLNEANFSIENL